jgi:hypothetical protein
MSGPGCHCEAFGGTLCLCSAYTRGIKQGEANARLALEALARRCGELQAERDAARAALLEVSACRARAKRQGGEGGPTRCCGACGQHAQAGLGGAARAPKPKPADVCPYCRRPSPGGERCETCEFDHDMGAY